MLNSIRGVVTGKAAGRFFLECGGIEWELEASHQALSALPQAGTTARVFTYLHHREDAMKLYGFADEAERLLFLDLLKVNGVGPKQALRILSGTSVDAFARILESGEAPALARIPGLGLKTAQKIILSLKGKLSLREEDSSGGAGDLVLALEDMGFDRRRAAQVVEALGAELAAGGLSGDELEKECFRQAIIRLSGNDGR